MSDSVVMLGQLAIVIVIVGGFAAAFLYQYGGLSGALFGARIRRQVGEVQATRRRSNQVLRVSALDRDDADGGSIGVLVVNSGLGFWQGSPISLSKSQAAKLSELLKKACDESE